MCIRDSQDVEGVELGLEGVTLIPHEGFQAVLAAGMYVPHVAGNALHVGGEAEQAELKKRAAALQAELDEAQAAAVNAEKFLGIVCKHLAFEELTPTLLREMIEKIVVHECSYDENEMCIRDRCSSGLCCGYSVKFSE